MSVKTREGMKFDDFIDVLFHYKKDYLATTLKFSFTYQHTVMNEYIVTIIYHA